MTTIGRLGYSPSAAEESRQIKMLKLSLCNHEDVEGSGGIAPLVLNLGLSVVLDGS
jgi:hypothetical protein